MADLKGFTEKYALNSRLVKRDGRLVEEVYRVGGRYSNEITRRSSGTSRRRSRSRPSRWPARLRALVQFYRTGETADRATVRHRLGGRTRHRPWTPSTGSSRSTWTPRGVKGAWEALVFYVNPEKTARIQTLAAQAQWFEDHMPCDREVPQAERHGHHRQRHRRRDRNRRLGAGHADRHQPAERPGRSARRYGSKSVSLSNVTEAYDKSTPGRRCAASSRGRRRRPSAPRSSDGVGRAALPNMHEVIGHASGPAGASGSRARRDERHQGALLGARRRRARTSSRSTSSPIPRSSSSASSPRRTRRSRPRRVRGLHAQRARAAAPHPRGHADRGRPHAQPADDRALADGQHEGDRAAAARRQDVPT